MLLAVVTCDMLKVHTHSWRVYSACLLCHSFMRLFSQLQIRQKYLWSSESRCSTLNYFDIVITIFFIKIVAFIASHITTQVHLLVSFCHLKYGCYSWFFKGKGPHVSSLQTYPEWIWIVMTWQKNSTKMFNQPSKSTNPTTTKTWFCFACTLKLMQADSKMAFKKGWPVNTGSHWRYSYTDLFIWNASLFM